MRKLIVLPLVAPCILIALQAMPSAQPDTVEPELYWKSYSLEGLPRGETGQLEFPSVAPMFGLSGAVKDSAPSAIVYSENWSLAYGSRSSPLFDATGGLASNLDDVCRHFGDFEVQERQGGKPQIEVLADKNGHAFVATLLKALRDWYAQRAAISVYHLQQAADAAVLSREQTESAIRRASLAGRQTGEPGEVLIWRDAALRTFITDYESYSIREGAEPSMVQRAFPQGWEVSAGVWPVGKDGLLVSAAFGRGSVKGVREASAMLSKIEMPDVTTAYSPACAVVHEGEGLVVGGEYLVVPAVRERFLPVNVGGAYINSAVAALDMTPLHAGAWPGSTDANVGIPAADADASRIQPYPFDAPDAAVGAASAYADSTDLDENYVDVLGPLVVIQPMEGAEDAANELEWCREYLESAPVCYAGDVDLYEIPAADLPAAPTPADLIAKGKRIANFHFAAVAGQSADWIDIEAENYLAGCYPITAAVATMDPVIEGVVSGSKIRARATTAGGKAWLEVMAAHAPAHKISAHTTPVGETEVYTESASAPAGALRVSANLEDNEGVSAVVPYPGDDSKRLVLFVKRVK